MNGMTCIAELPHDRYGSAIFVKEGTTVESIHTDDENNIKTLSVDLGSIVITSVYKPPATPFKLPPLLQSHKNRIVIGDFNSHNIQLGYNSTNEDGTAIEQWSDSNQLFLVHDAKHPSCFNSARWKAGYNPDIAFVNQTIGSLCKNGVLNPISRTQHCPISVNVQAAVTPTIVPYQHHFNFQKADWISFTTDLENQIYNITPNPKMYKLFTNLVQNIARKHIPRGFRTRFVSCLNEESLNMLDKYKTSYKEDPLAEDTITGGEQLIVSMTQEHQRKWLDTIESTDMSRNSKKAWNLIRKLNNDPAIPKHQHYPVTANQVAHQLLVNGQTKGKKAFRVKFRKNKKQNMEPNPTSPFTAQEFFNGIAAIKNGKAIGLDGIFTEELKHFGQQAEKWLLEPFNRCV